MKNFLKWIGLLFASAARKLWNSLTPEEQQNLKYGSGVIDVINKYLDETPMIIETAIKNKYPDFDLQKLITLVNLAGLNTDNVAMTVQDAITKLKTYLLTKQDKVWQWASSALAELLTVALNPSLTVFEKVSTLIQYVYSKFIKKD